jgi:hypothetical protein
MGENLKQSRVKVNPKIQLLNNKKNMLTDMFDMCVLDADTSTAKKACRKKAIDNCKENSVDGKGKNCSKLLKSGQQEKVKDLLRQMKEDDSTVDKATFEAKAIELLKESMPGLTDKKIKKE